MAAQGWVLLREPASPIGLDDKGQPLHADSLVGSAAPARCLRTRPRLAPQAWAPTVGPCSALQIVGSLTS